MRRRRRRGGRGPRRRPRRPSRWPAACASPSSRISPRIAIRRVAGSPARSSSAARTDSGAALYASSTIVTPPARITVERCLARDGAARPGTISSSPRPAARPAATPASALCTASRPSPAISTRAIAGGGDESERHAVETARDDVVRAHVGVGREAVGRRAGARARGHPEHPRVVGVEDRDPAVVGRRERLDQLRLRVLDRLERSDPGQVDRLHGGHDPDRRPPDRGQLADLAADVHAHLEHRGLVPRPQAEHRQRQADLVVLVALRAQRDEPALQHARDGLLGGGLGDAAGDPDDQRREPGAPGRGHRVQGPERIRDEDHGDVAEGLERRLTRVRVGQPPDQDRGGARRGGRGEVSMPVGPLALQRDEQVAGLDEPGVDGPAADGAVAASHEGPARDGGDLLGRQPGGSTRHHARECRIGHGHGLTPASAGIDSSSGIRNGVLIASCAIRRNSSNDMTGISRWPRRMTVGVPSSIRTATTRSGWPG